MHTPRFARAASAVALALALSLTAAGCGSSEGSSTSKTSSSAEHNKADVTFASDMLEHHAQALAMVDLTTGRTLDPQVAKLATQIKAAQTPEITTFTGWLKDWDQKVPSATGKHDMNDMGSEMPGMMSADEMTALENAPDSEFQDMWLAMMVKHHQGAVTMAKTEIKDGKYEPAVELAQQIVTSQSQEIETMQTILSNS